jgi:glutamyl-tRNA synthetase
VRGRYAPSPTGAIHVGNARTALAAWLSARSQGGSFVWRNEDLDTPRVVPGLAARQAADLAWLGLDWDESWTQSTRGAFYEEALAALAAAGWLFPCRLSRKDLATLASAPHGREGETVYPASLRPSDNALAPDWYAAFRGEGKVDAALRFRVHDRPVRFTDRVQGEQEERVDQTVGDFVLKRRDGLYAYQLAVVVDDLAMGITEVVRGADLLASTARQIQLIEALGGTVPEYAHVPLVVSPTGEKLSKRDAGLTLEALRAGGMRPEELVGRLAASLGLIGKAEPCRPEELVAEFSWERVGRGDEVWSAHLGSCL